MGFAKDTKAVSGERAEVETPFSSVLRPVFLL